MKKLPTIGILAQGGAVPAVNGGAVETLIESLVEQNEIYKRCRLIIFGIYEERAALVVDERSYKYTNFEYIKPNLIERIYFRVLREIRDRLYIKKMKTWCLDSLTYNSLKISQKYNFDALIIQEGKRIEGLNAYQKIYGDSLFYHSHLHEIPVNGTLYHNIITISNFCGNEWKSCVKSENIHTVYNGINLEKFKRRITEAERDEVRHEIGFSKDDFVVMYVGRIVPVKGVLELAKALLSITDTRIKLMIVGSSSFANGKRTDYTDKVMELAETTPDRIKFTGFVKNADLYKYYQISQMQVVPSICEEAAGLVAIEGMTSGLPLVVTRSGGMVEYVSEECAVIVNKDEKLVDSLAKAILDLYKDDNKRLAMAEAGMKRAERFSEKNFYDSFMSVVLRK